MLIFNIKQSAVQYYYNFAGLQLYQTITSLHYEEICIPEYFSNAYCQSVNGWGYPDKLKPKFAIHPNAFQKRIDRD